MHKLRYVRHDAIRVLDYKDEGALRELMVGGKVNADDQKRNVACTRAKKRKYHGYIRTNMPVWDSLRKFAISPCLVTILEIMHQWVTIEKWKNENSQSNQKVTEDHAEHLLNHAPYAGVFVLVSEIRGAQLVQPDRWQQHLDGHENQHGILHASFDPMMTTAGFTAVLVQTIQQFHGIQDVQHYLSNIPSKGYTVVRQFFRRRSVQEFALSLAHSWDTSTSIARCHVP